MRMSSDVNIYDCYLGNIVIFINKLVHLENMFCTFFYIFLWKKCIHLDTFEYINNVQEV